MQKTVFLFIILIIAVSAFSQQSSPSSTLLKQDYLGKSKKQKTTAAILFGGGLLSTYAGLATLAGKCAPESANTDNFIMIGAGFTAIVTSIPLFVISHINKRKGLRMAFINQPALQIINNSFVYKTIPSINFKISL